MIIVKEHIRGADSILSLCDKELIGKKFEEADLQLDLTSNFYKGEEKTKDELRKIVPKFRIVNAVGHKSVNLLLEFGLVEKDRIIVIKDIPHAQCVNDMVCD
jgi:hypothetical protein